MDGRTGTRGTTATAVSVRLRPPVVVIQSGVAEVARQLPGGVMTHHLVKTSLDDRGIKWVSLRDVCEICCVVPPERVDEDDIIYPVYFSECDSIRAAVSLTSLNVFFDRIGYTKRYRFFVFNSVLEYWKKWFARESQSIHPMHEAYAHVLNSCVEPAIEIFLERYEEASREDRPEGLTAIVVYTMLYPRLLQCIGQTQHVDFEDLTIVEITRLMSVMSTFSLALLTVVIDISEIRSDPMKLMDNILRNSIYKHLYSYNESCSVMEDIVEECYDPEGIYKGLSEITFR